VLYQLSYSAKFYALTGLEPATSAFGWDGWTRTSDHRVNSSALYRLSYIPKLPTRSGATCRLDQRGTAAGTGRPS
jgi:hypothetical protein